MAGLGMIAALTHGGAMLPPGPPANAEPFDRLARRRQRERAVAGFANHDFLKQAIADDLADRVAGLDRRFARVLDLGSHAGSFGRFSNSDMVVALDTAPGFARAGAPLAVAADEDRLPFADASFDLIVSAASLHGVNDLPGALIQVRRALAPGGVFLAGLFGGTSLNLLRRDLLEAEDGLTGRAAARVSPMVDSEAAAGLLQRAGFVDPVAEVDNVTVRYGDLFALLRDLRGMGEGNILSSRVPLRRDVLMEAARRFAARADADGRVTVTLQILYLTGWSRA